MADCSSHIGLRNAVEPSQRTAELCSKPDSAPSGLRAVIEQLMRDPSKAQEIAARLQQEDPELFQELLA